MKVSESQLFKLVELDDVVKPYGHECEVIPSDALCPKCRYLSPGWFPKSAPTVRLMLLKEALYVPLLGFMVLHEALYELLKPYWPQAIVTRCSVDPKSRVKAGSKYLALSLPDLYCAEIMFPSGVPWQCEVCQRWLYSGKALEPSIVPRADQRGLPAIAANRWQEVLFTESLCDQVSALGIGDIGRETVTIRERPMRRHVLPRIHRFRLPNKERAVLREYEGEGFACLVCGKMLERPQYLANDGVHGASAQFSTPTAEQECPCCHVRFDVDILIEATSRPRAFQKAVVMRRTEWLNGRRWSDDAGEQLLNGLGINFNHAKLDAKDFSIPIEQ